MDSMDHATSDTSRLPFPVVGTPWSELERQLVAAKAHDIDWRAGKLALYNYYRNDELLRVAQDAYRLYFAENALGGDVFPSLAKMEREIVEMGLSLFDAPGGADGSFTTGGTESIFLAVCAARNSTSVKGRPNIVTCETLHPAFDKAGMFLGVDVIRTPMGLDFRADPTAMEAAIDENTIMIAASAPGFTHGVFDPISEIAAMALRRSVWLHVDACLGGFLAPFWRELGQPVPDFDFRLLGVTSISADLHKYGFAARGASLVLLRSAALKPFYGFEFSAWSYGGIYATETYSGSRPGGSIAAAWTMIKHLGSTGYIENARMILDAKTRLTAGIDAIPGLAVIYPSELGILLFRSTDPEVDLYALAEVLSHSGWYVGLTASPKAITNSLNPVHAISADEYLSDLRNAVEEVRSKGLRGTGNLRTY